MFDLGWSELLVIGIVALIVVGPKDLPRMLRTLGQYAARARSMAREFQRSMDEAARQADIDELRDVKKSLDDVRDAQYKMQREMSQSFLDAGKTSDSKSKKPETRKPETAKTSDGAGEKKATDKPASADAPPAVERAAGPAAAPAEAAPEPEPEPRKASGA